MVNGSEWKLANLAKVPESMTARIAVCRASFSPSVKELTFFLSCTLPPDFFTPEIVLSLDTAVHSLRKRVGQELNLVWVRNCLLSGA